jgi:hypothetical protein
LCLLRCRACQGLFFLRSRQVLAAEARAAEYFHGHHRGKHHGSGHHVRPPSPVEPVEPVEPVDRVEPVDLDSIEHQLAAARERLLLRE